MDLFIFQCLGYFPIPTFPDFEFRHPDCPLQRSENGLFSRIKLFIFSSWYLISTFAFLAISIVTLLILLLRLYFEGYAFTGPRATMDIKAILHLCCSISVKLGMLFSRKRIRFLHENALKIVHTLASSKPPSNRLRKPFLIRAITHIGVSLTLMAAMVMSFAYNGISSLFETYMFLVPVIVGCLHSIFGFVYMYFLNCYLEGLFLLKQNLKDFITLNQHHPQPKQNDVARMWCSKELFNFELISIYNNLKNEVDQFCKTFGFWLVIDIGHSLMRIIFCSYFMISVTYNSEYRTIAVLYDCFVVVLYAALVYMVCERGSAVTSVSEEVVDCFEAISKVHHLVSKFGVNFLSCMSCQILLLLL